MVLKIERSIALNCVKYCTRDCLYIGKAMSTVQAIGVQYKLVKHNRPKARWACILTRGMG